MKILVKVDLPDINRNVPAQDRTALRWAGVSLMTLRSSWAASCAAVLRKVFPTDRWVVEVRKHAANTGPRFYVDGRGVASNDCTETVSRRATEAIEHAAIAWCASLGHITMLRMVARRRAQDARNDRKQNS